MIVLIIFPCKCFQTFSMKFFNIIIFYLFKLNPYKFIYYYESYFSVIVFSHESHKLMRFDCKNWIVIIWNAIATQGQKSWFTFNQEQICNCIKRLLTYWNLGVKQISITPFDSVGRSFQTRSNEKFRTLSTFIDGFVYSLFLTLILSTTTRIQEQSIFSIWTGRKHVYRNKRIRFEKTNVYLNI